MKPETSHDSNSQADEMAATRPTAAGANNGPPIYPSFPMLMCKRFMPGHLFAPPARCEPRRWAARLQDLVAVLAMWFALHGA